ncbi:pectate lyase [Paenibacillus algorifonticola]|uniref:Pectate lyase n=1 Tax=Paenibacillus algorifonticola TaxID=684063 RepID=A0A1I2HSI9_9BACL|nr:family 16 glycoside hydrolase [Paenibacillus algorifonticola]SFF31676.1 pectate lyase [Paenibacillus algorifonticola]
MEYFIKRNVIFVLCLALVLSAGSVGFVYRASAAALLEDGFDSGAGNWTATSGSWSVVQENGNAVYSQSGTSEGRTSAGSQSWTDYAVEADVKIVDFKGSTRTYVAGRYLNGNNFYAASLYNSSGGTLEIRKKVSGSTTTLASKTNFGLAAGVWYKVKLEMSGTSIKLYVNDQLELSATDSSLTAGAAGLVTFKSIAKFDNVSVTNSGSVPTTPTPSPTAAPTPTPTVQPTTAPSPSPTVTPAPTPTPSPTAGQTGEYQLTGFSVGNTGGGSIAETDSQYIKVYNATDLAVALKKGSGYKVVEIMNDLDLGWNEIPAAAKVSPFASHNSALTHPVLLNTGVSKITVDGFTDLTIFSANGATIKHAAFTFKRSSNVIIRNLEFDELWEWDEATKGDYDKNDWDYITIEESSKFWIDHCTFHKAYDGLVDVKKGSNGVTISWSSFLSDDRSAGSWVTQQINAMEANQSAYPMYAFLRSSAVGLSKDDIIAVAASQKKGHLVGSTELASDNAALEVTLHHNYYQDQQDRMPRLRAGNVHAYNIVMDSAGAWSARALITAAMESAISGNGYHFGITSNGAISTENGAVLVEKSVIIDVYYPLRNNQKDASNAVYTGKIAAIDTIYSMDGTTFRGNSDTVGSPLSPVPAAIQPFSWNGFTTLPYSYTADDPATLKARLIAANGAGSGKLSWAKVNWLQTS